MCSGSVTQSKSSISNLNQQPFKIWGNVTQATEHLCRTCDALIQYPAPQFKKKIEMRDVVQW